MVLLRSTSSGDAALTQRKPSTASTNTTASTADDEKVGRGLEAAEGSQTLSISDAEATREFYSTMMAAGRQDLIESAENTESTTDVDVETATCAHSASANNKHDADTLEKAQLKLLRVQDQERQQTADALAKAQLKTLGQEEGLVQQQDVLLEKAQAVGRTSSLDPAKQKAAGITFFGDNKAPGAYEEAPGRQSVRRETSQGAVSSLGSSRLSLGDLSEEEEKEEEQLTERERRTMYGESLKEVIHREYCCEGTGTASLTGLPSSNFTDDAGEVAGDEPSPMPPISLPDLESLPHSSLVEAHTVDEMVEVSAKPIERWTPKKITILVLGSLVLVAIIVATATTLTLAKQGSKTLSTPRPTLAPTLSPAMRWEVITELITQTDASGFAGTNPAILEHSNSPHSRALEWLVEDDALRVPEQDVGHIRQRYSLAVLYFSTGGPTNWTDQYEFLLPTHECTWSGALLCNNNTVTGIDLASNNLVGRLPPELGLLSDLRVISMDNNKLTGQLPSVLPPRLLRLDIWNNDLVGTIPPLYGNMTELESFRIGKNGLEGTIPSEIGSLTKLTVLSLESNRLTGSIPDLWNLTRMEDFQIGQQSLTGTLSPLVGRWTNTTVFHVNKLNGITGSIPTQFGLLTQLTNLKFSQNHLRGTLPSELGNLHQVSLLAISRNGLTGTVPTEFGRLSSVEQIYLQNTWLTGDMNYICGVKEEGDLPLLQTFNADLEEVNCTCCTCCLY